jgi:adenylate cyclase
LTAERVERRLAAVLAADVAGYSHLMGADEEGTLARLKAVRKSLVDPTIAAHRGRIVKTTGDGMLVEFASSVDAVTCAIVIQEKMAERSASGAEPRIVFRIGINVGDVIIDGDDIFGDGVNVAARVENECEPGGVCVSGNAFEQIRGKTKFAFDDLGEKALKNIERPVRLYAVRAAPSRAATTTAAISTTPSNASNPLPLPDKPSIAVLSFTNMTGDPDQEYFGDGIAEDIITMLSRSRSLFVIARNSSFTYKGRAVDVKQIARELGVRYVLEGSVRRGGNRVRITAQLIDAETGNHLWADRYDRDPADVFAVQDEITEAVAIAIEPAVAEMERQRAVRKPPESLGAWEAYQRGLWHMGRIGLTDNEAAKSFFRRAIELDPNFAPPHAWLANAIFQGAVLYQTSSFAEAADELLPLAERAVCLDRSNAVGHLGIASGLQARGDHDGSLAEMRQALAISPNDATAHHFLGFVLLFSGRPREGIEAIRRAMRLDPNGPVAYHRLVHIAMAHYFLREYDAAVESAKEAIRSHPDHPWPHRWLAAALGQAGRLDEAKQALQKAIAIGLKSFDMYVRQRPPWMRPADHEHMLEGPRKAGWES